MDRSWASAALELGVIFLLAILMAVSIGFMANLFRTKVDLTFHDNVPGECRTAMRDTPPEGFEGELFAIRDDAYTNLGVGGDMDIASGRIGYGHMSLEESPQWFCTPSKVRVIYLHHGESLGGTEK